MAVARDIWFVHAWAIAGWVVAARLGKHVSSNPTSRLLARSPRLTQTLLLEMIQGKRLYLLTGKITRT